MNPATTQTTLPDTGERIVELDPRTLRDSPFQKRTTYAAIDELAANIRADGRIHEPVIVRPVPGGLELVAGHRRKRAAILAKWATVPAVVREMTDEAARAAQASENLQRENLHAFEEAETYAQMMREDGLDADDIVERTGKSRTQVYGRLKLLQAAPAVREACEAGELDAEAALLIARLRDHALQVDAIRHLRSHNVDEKDGGRQSFRRIREILAERYMLELKRAVFPIADESLLPEAGACGPCPRRTGNAPEFDDIVSGKKPWPGAANPVGPDVCTDPECFGRKKAAHLKRQADELEARGRRVITGHKARQVLGVDGSIKASASTFVDEETGKKALQAAGAKVAPVIVQDPRSGKQVRVFDVAELASAGAKVKPAKAKESTDDRRNRAELERQRAYEAESLALLAPVRAAMRTASRSVAELAIIARAVVTSLDHADLVDLAGGNAAAVNAHGYRAFADDAVTRAEVSMDPANELALLMLEALAIQSAKGHDYSEHPTGQRLRRLASLYGVTAVDQAEASSSPPAGDQAEASSSPPAGDQAAAKPRRKRKAPAETQTELPLDQAAEALQEAASGPAAAAGQDGQDQAAEALQEAASGRRRRFSRAD